MYKKRPIYSATLCRVLGVNPLCVICTMSQAKKRVPKKRKTYPKLSPVAKRIKELRIKSGRSKEAFAADVDLSRTLYASYENGANITVVNLMRIIEGLGVTTRQFFDTDEFDK